MRPARLFRIASLGLFLGGATLTGCDDDATTPGDGGTSDTGVMVGDAAPTGDTAAPTGDGGASDMAAPTGDGGTTGDSAASDSAPATGDAGSDGAAATADASSTD
jgi:hypothetical protein